MNTIRRKIRMIFPKTHKTTAIQNVFHYSGAIGKLTRILLIIPSGKTLTIRRVFRDNAEEDSADRVVGHKSQPKRSYINRDPVIRTRGCVVKPRPR